MFDSRSPQQGRVRLLTILLLAALVVGTLVPASAAAAVQGCRFDPILFLSNGVKVRVTATVAADLAGVERVTYAVHAPAGTSVTKIVYPGAAGTEKEVVHFFDDLPANRYRTVTLVETREAGVAVIANTAVGRERASVSGRSGEHLTLDFQLDG